MIAEYKVENFKSIGSEQTLSFVATRDNTNESDYVTVMPDGTRLLKVAMIFGANATGKSTLLKALDFFFRLVLKKHEDWDKGWKDRKPFKFNPKYDDEPTKMKLTFYFRERKHELEIKCLNGIITYEKLSVYKSTRATTLYERKYKSLKGNYTLFNEKNIKLSQADKNSVNAACHDDMTVISAYHSCFKSKKVEKCGLEDLYDYFKNGYTGLFSNSDLMLERVHKLVFNRKGTDTEAFFGDWLKNGSFEKLDSISMDRSDDTKTLKFNYYYNDRLVDLSESEICDGGRRFLGLGSLVYEHLTSNCFIMLDGLDLGLHPKLRRFFLRSFLRNSQKYSQLIFTTNAYYVLDREFIRRDTIWFTEKTDEFETMLIRLSSCKIRKNALVHKAYKKGLIVKLPYIGDHFIDLTKYTIEKSEDDDKKPKKKEKPKDKVILS